MHGVGHATQDQHCTAMLSGTHTQARRVNSNRSAPKWNRCAVLQSSPSPLRIEIAVQAKRAVLRSGVTGGDNVYAHALSSLCSGFCASVVSTPAGGAHALNRQYFAAASSRKRRPGGHAR
jgi:hypothetical protein